MKRLLTFIALLLSLNCNYARVINYSTDTYNDIAQVYEDFSSEPEKTLLVFDIDDTLLTMTQALGSVGWWDWQYKLQKEDPENPMLFTRDFKQLVRIQSVLFSIIKMKVTEPNVIGFMRHAAKQHVTVLGLTARGPEQLSVTITQLEDNKFSQNNKLLFEGHGLKPRDFECPELGREHAFSQGVAFVAGADKGLALRCLLKSSKQKFKTILFVDDSETNIHNMENAFKDSQDIEVHNILYTRYKADQAKAREDKSMQAKEFYDWQRIDSTVDDVIQSPTI